MIPVRQPFCCIFQSGPANPVQPANLMNIDTRHDRATVQWSVSYIAYTPETYTVNYSLATGSPGMLATAAQRGDNFALPSQPFMFSAVLTGLSPGQTYNYHLEARNSVGTTLSVVQQFTSNQQRTYMSILIVSVYQALLPSILRPVYYDIGIA